MTQININVNNQPMSVISPISLSELIALKQLKDEAPPLPKMPPLSARMNGQQPT